MLRICAFLLMAWCPVHPRTLKQFFWKAVKQSLYEQEVEDVNAVHKIDNHLVRRLIVMPLSETFNPNEADAMHNKIQYGDRCSLPSSIGRIIMDRRYEVPWIFEMVPVKSTNESCETNPRQLDALSEDPSYKELMNYVENISKGKLEKAYISPLDFRSPENYIFLPKWLMNDLDLKPNDLVDISFVRIKLADLITFQPLSENWDELMKDHSDPKTLLEHEINKYSSLTAGSTIYIEVKGVEYPLYVKETFAEGDISVNGVRVMDSDVKTDIDREILDAIKELKESSQKGLENQN